MLVLVHAVGLSLLAFLLHVCIWRWRIPKRATLAILVLFDVTAAVGAMIHACLPAAWRVFDAGSIGRIVFFVCLVGICHAINYTGLEEDSPSCTIVKYVALREPEGCDPMELRGILDEGDFVGARLQALMDDGLIEKRVEGYWVTRKGERWLWVFDAWVRLLGLSQGG